MLLSTNDAPTLIILWVNRRGGFRLMLWIKSLLRRDFQRHLDLCVVCAHACVSIVWCVLVYVRVCVSFCRPTCTCMHIGRKIRPINFGRKIHVEYKLRWGCLYVCVSSYGVCECLFECAWVLQRSAHERTDFNGIYLHSSRCHNSLWNSTCSRSPRSWNLQAKFFLLVKS